MIDERDTYIGLEDAAGVLAQRGNVPTQIRLYATWDDCQHNTGVARIGDQLRMIVNGRDIGPVRFPISTTTEQETVL